MAGSTSSRWLRAARVARAIGLLIAFGLAWLMAGWARTQELGFSPGVLAIALLFGAPAATLPVLGLRWRVAVLVVLAVVWLAVVAAEIPATLEEVAFRRQHRDLPPTAPAVFQRRFWPFGNHHLYYEPATQRWGAGD